MQVIQRRKKEGRKEREENQAVVLENEMKVNGVKAEDAKISARWC